MISISTDEVVELHDLLIDRFGGTHGIRSRESLESSIYSVFQTFEGKDLYPTDVEKTIRLSYTLTMNHCFLDGNKRIGSFILIYLLKANGHKLTLTHQELIDLFLDTASGKYTYDKFKKMIVEKID